MARSGGMGQLLKGMVIGIVLLLAIVGTMSIFNKDPTITLPGSNPDSGVNQTANNIPAPSINVASNSTPKASEDTTKTQDNFTPTLEGEKTAEDLAAEKEKRAKKEQAEAEAKPEFGNMVLAVINPKNKEKLKASFVIFDNKNNKVAESKDTESTSFKLLAGEYRVVTTLTNTHKTSRKVEPVQTTNTINVLANKTSSQTFNLEPASTLGVLQVSAVNAQNNKAIRANFIIQKENGENVADRKNVSSSLFKLNAGSYKVTVRSGNNSDYRTIVVEPGQSTQEVFKLQEAYKLGRLLVRIFDIKTNNPLEASITISTMSGTTVQSLKSVSKTEITLPPADYNINVVGSTGKSSKRIRLAAGKSISEVFRFDAPQQTTSIDEPATGVQITDNVRITGNTPQPEETAPTPQTTTTETATPEESSTPTTEPATVQTVDASIRLFAKDEKSNRPLKSNFYVQTPNGKHIAKKIYADSAEFNLPTGTYRITVRSKNRSNIIRTLRVEAGQQINESFLLKSTLNTNKTASQATLSPQKPTPTAPVKNKVIPNGFLNVQMQPARNTHFIISKSSGEKVVELTSVPSGNFKLDTGRYTVTAIHNNTRRKRNIIIRQGKKTNVIFNARDFVSQSNANTATAQRAKGTLKSSIVDLNGRALRGNLTISDMRGQVVARANAVTVGSFNLPAAPYTITVDYQGLRGSERVRIISSETTVQTFTITPPNTAAQPRQQDNRSIEQRLKDRIKEEIEKQF